MSFVYKADPFRGARRGQLFAEQAPHIPFRLWPYIGDPAEVRHIASWIPPADLHARFPNLQSVFSVGAGVDQFDMDAVPAHVPAVRMIEPGITDRMVEYVTYAVLTLNRGFHRYDALQVKARWQPMPNRLASEVRVDVLGPCGLPRALLARLRIFGYPCAAWSRSSVRSKVSIASPDRRACLSCWHGLTSWSACCRSPPTPAA